MSELNDKIEEAIKSLHDQIESNVDQEFVKNAGPTMDRLINKENKDIRDIVETMKVLRNVIIPLAMKTEIEKLRGIGQMVENELAKEAK
jgi:hypothetical protein